MLDVAQATADEFSAQGIEARAYAANVAKFEDAENTVAAVVRDFGRLDILVNNAGITKDTLMLKMTEDMWDAVIAVNLKGTFNFTKAAVRPMMKQRAGKIVNIASVVGRMGNVGRRTTRLRRRRHCAGQDHGEGVRDPEHPGQRGRAGLHRNRDDREASAGGARCVPDGDPGQARRPGRRMWRTWSTSSARPTRIT